MEKKLLNIFGAISFYGIVLLVVCSMITDLGLWIEYLNPKVTAQTTSIIDTSNDPIQLDLSGKDYIKAKGERKNFVLNLQAEYSISGLVVAKNTNFWFRDLMRNNFDDICLIDLGIAWGELSKNKTELYDCCTFKSQKTLGEARMLRYFCRNLRSWSFDYVKYHVSHTHMIPATKNVMKALSSIKKNDIVKIDGYLVDIYTDKTEIVSKTSLSRTDSNPTSRGYGACEVMYVKQVQIGNKIYR